MNKDTSFLNGEAVKPKEKTISVFGSVKPKAPQTIATKTDEGTAKISGNTPSLGSVDGVKPQNNQFEKTGEIKKPVEKKCEGGDCETKNEGVTFKFDRIWRELTEADDLPIGGETNTPDANIEGDSFDDDTGDLDPMEDDTADDTDDVGAEDPIAVLREIRDRIDAVLAANGEGDDDLLDDDDTALDPDAETADEPTDDSGDATEGVPPTQNESWQRKTALGPKMSDKAPGKLGKKKGGKMGKGTLKKNVVDGKGKKVPLSKFSPKMSDKVSRLKKGDLF